MRFIQLVTMLVFATALIVSAQDDSERLIQSKIIALEKAWNQAYKLEKAGSRPNPRRSDCAD